MTTFNADQREEFNEAIMASWLQQMRDKQSAALALLCGDKDGKVTILYQGGLSDSELRQLFESALEWMKEGG